MTKLTIELLEKFVNDIKTDGMCEITDSQVESALIRLLAYEQAAEKPYGYLEPCDFPRTTATVYPEKDKYAFMPLYAAPVLPKQPEPVAWRFDELAAKGMVVTVYKSVANSWIARGFKATPLFELAPAQPVIPEHPEPTISFYRDGIIAAAKWVENQRDAYDNEHGQSDPDTGAFEFGNDAQLEYSTTLSEIAEGIRSLHPTSAQPVSEPYKLPSGYTLVPCKLTAENGAKSCMIGEFTEQTEISCPECFGDDECETCDGSGMIEVTVPVSWTTIKDIWAKGIEHFAAAPAQESE